jgi:hypothetical protein
METAGFSHVEAVLSIDDDFDCDELICRLVGPLAPLDRIAFRRAAEETLARAGPCWGEAAVYRAAAALQRMFFGTRISDRALNRAR